MSGTITVTLSERNIRDAALRKAADDLGRDGRTLKLVRSLRNRIGYPPAEKIEAAEIRLAVSKYIYLALMSARTQ